MALAEVSRALRGQDQALARRNEPETVREWPFQLRDGVGNSTLRTALHMINEFHDLGDPRSIPALKSLMDCFQPVQTPDRTPIGQPDTLWDQIGSTIFAFRHLDIDQREQVTGVFQTLLWTLQHVPLERKVHGEKQGLPKDIQALVLQLNEDSETWTHTTTPKDKRKRGVLAHIPLPAKLATGLSALSILLAGCGEAKPTINPDPTATRPAITQPAPTETPRPTTEPTRRPTTEPTRRPTTEPTRRPTQTATETQPASRAVLFSDMSLESGAAQCTENLLDLNDPHMNKQLAAMIQSINEQVGDPDNVYWRMIPGSYVGDSTYIYPTTGFYYQALAQDGIAPVPTCGEIHLNDSIGRLEFIRIPFPLAGGGSEFITIALVHEPSAERLMEQVRNDTTYTTYLSDEVIFPFLQQGPRQVRIEIFVNDYYNHSPADQADWDTWMQQRIELSGSVIVPQLFAAREQAHFTELFVRVFVNGERDPETLAALKALMDGQLIPGFIFQDEP